MAVQKLVIDNFLGGMAPSPFIGNPNGQADPGLSNERTKGWDPNIAGYIGVLRRGYQLDTITNVSLFQGLISQRVQVVTNGNPYLYLIGQDDNLIANRFYQVDLVTNTVTNNATFPHTLGGASGVGLGMELFGKYAYYAAGRYLGRFDLSITFNDSFSISLSTTAYGGGTIAHPMAQGNGKLFIGNVDANGNAVITTVDSSDVVTLVALDLTKTGQFVKALEFTDTNLFIGMSLDKDNTLTTNVESYLYIWDTVSGAWQQRFRFPQGNISCIKSFPGGVFVFGRTGVFRFNGSGFDPIFQQYAGGPNVHGADMALNGMIFFKTGSNQIIYSYGSVDPSIPAAINRPYRSAGGENGFLKWTSDGSLWTSGYTSAPYVRRFTAGGISGYNGDGEWWTPQIQFPNKARFNRITIFTFPVSDTSTSVDISWANQDGSNIQLINQIQQTKSVPGTNNSKFQFAYNGLVDFAWQIKLLHTSGTTPFIRRIEIEYEVEKD